MYKEEVIRELPNAGKYRVRILAGDKLDIREYISNEKFSGFTRKGIRLGLDEFRTLMDSVAGYVAEGK